jgi:hypothetical protein
VVALCGVVSLVWGEVFFFFFFWGGGVCGTFGGVKLCVGCTFQIRQVYGVLVAECLGWVVMV